MAARYATVLSMNIMYPSDLSDTEWKGLQHYLRASRSDCRMRRHGLCRIRERHLLCSAYGLSVALFAQQFPTLANGVLSFSPRLPCADGGHGRFPVCLPAADPAPDRFA